MPIITAIDGSDASTRTIDVAYELAQECDEELIIMHVMPQEAFEEFQNATAGQEINAVADGTRYGSVSGESHVQQSPGDKHTYTVQDGEQNAANIAEDALAEALDDWRNVTIQGRVGEPVKEILDEAERRDARYLVIGGRKRTPVGKAVFGSTTQSILLNASIPVMTVMTGD